MEEKENQDVKEKWDEKILGVAYIFHRARFMMRPLFTRVQAERVMNKIVEVHEKMMQ